MSCLWGVGGEIRVADDDPVADDREAVEVEPLILDRLEHVRQKTGIHTPILWRCHRQFGSRAKFCRGGNGPRRCAAHEKDCAYGDGPRQSFHRTLGALLDVVVLEL